MLQDTQNDNDRTPIMYGLLHTVAKESQLKTVTLILRGQPSYHEWYSTYKEDPNECRLYDMYLAAV